MTRRLQNPDGGRINRPTLSTGMSSAAVAGVMVRQLGDHPWPVRVTGLILGLMLSVAAAQPPPHLFSKSPMASSAVPKPGLPRLPVKLHPTSAKYIYALVNATIRFNPLCGPGRTLLFVRARVENSSANAVSMPVRVKVMPLKGLAKGGSAMVPHIAAHSTVWVQVPVPYPQQLKPGMASLGITLSFAGQTWSGGPLQVFLSPNRCVGKHLRVERKPLPPRRGPGR